MTSRTGRKTKLPPPAAMALLLVTVGVLATLPLAGARAQGMAGPDTVGPGTVGQETRQLKSQSSGRPAGQEQPAAPQSVSPAPPEARGSAELIRRSNAELQAKAKAIGALRSAVDAGLVPSFRMQAAITDLEARRLELRNLVDRLTPAMADAKARQEQLGVAPKDGAQEPPDLARQRKALAEETGGLDAAIKRAEVLFVQAGQALASLNALRRAQFTRQLLERSHDIATTAFWRQALTEIGPLAWEGLTTVATRLAGTVYSYPLTVLGGLLLAVVMGLGSHWLLGLMIVRRWATTSGWQTRTRAERGAKALLRACRRTLPMLVAIGAVLAVTTGVGLPTGESGQVLRMSLAYLAVSLFLVAVVWYALNPAAASDRLLQIDDTTARRLVLVLTMCVVVWLGDQVFTLLDKVLATPLVLVILRLVLVSLIYAVLLTAAAVIIGRFATLAKISPRSRGVALSVCGIMLLMAVFILVAATMGYVSLARFAGGQIVATGGLLLLVTLVHLTAEFISTRQVATGEPEAAEAASKVSTGFMSATLGVVLGIGLDLATLLIGIPLLLLQWGYGPNEVFGWVRSAFFGFTVGSVRISLQTLFLGLLILAGGIFATRTVRNMLLRRMEHVFIEDNGARDSLATVMTYSGFVASLLAAIAYMGISLSSLAIVAGALSVGIGFGLQSIASNFVSGLILLAERPIKVGDWIVLGEQQGRVQKISVRSTEIETFDRSTLIVPNSDLITQRVVNWTYGDTSGRLIIPVGVSYDADPREVIELLLLIGRDNPRTLAYPEPMVVFEAFGDNALEFTLRVYLRDISTRLSIQTELRVAIVETLRQRGIELPFPQRDIHIRSDVRQRDERSPTAPAIGTKVLAE